MIELIYVGIFYTALALILCWRIAKGPSVVDRVVAGDAADMLITCALILFSIYSGRSIYLDVALVTALLGFIGTVLVSRYLEGRLK